MSETPWTRAIKDALYEVAERLQFEGFKEEHWLEIEGKRFRVDGAFIGGSRGAEEIIFEIDRFNPKKIYPKTILGSVITGLVLALQHKSIFIEITTANKTGERAKAVVTALKKELPEIRKRLHIILIPDKAQFRDEDKNLLIDIITNEITKIQLENYDFHHPQ